MMGATFPNTPEFRTKPAYTSYVLYETPPRPIAPKNHAPPIVANLALANIDRQVTDLWLNNRTGQLHLPFRQQERSMTRFKRLKNLQKLAAVHASAFNRFNQERSLSSRQIFKLNRAAALAK
ncbi:hypothetical protein SAMN05444398_101912 [Roseovarius pacificus]|uniref:Uncharacterized protein n=1 Tax=Roseovarius pacificus TaxID=337701 RepID=A0A1M6YKL3_9RHOB|nr:hypothetical protein [Roseovarius pacificus]GGO50721.1 hypothetical protein GCM10011315_02170 [Roseovarius pacificus]SHL18861.1 hypothetical protein SAMN05444398_101912 [Roseovarius pacificus]